MPSRTINFTIFGYTNSGDGPYSHPITFIELVRNYSSSPNKNLQTKFKKAVLLFKPFAMCLCLFPSEIVFESICINQTFSLSTKDEKNRCSVWWEHCQQQPEFSIPGKNSLGNSVPLGVVGGSCEMVGNRSLGYYYFLLHSRWE